MEQRPVAEATGCFVIGGSDVLKGEHVTLRAIEAGDLDAAWRWANDGDVTQWLASLRYPVQRKDEEAWLSNTPTNGFDGVRLAIVSRAGKHIGNINLHRLHPEDRKAGLGIMIGEKDHWSNGYGTDAIRTLLRFAFDEMNLHRIWLHVYADNERAIACYRKCGFREEVRLRQDVYQGARYRDVVVLGILEDEFRTQRQGKGTNHA